MTAVEPNDTLPPSPVASTLPCPSLPEPEHEPFCIVRPVTFLPTFDFSHFAEEAFDEDS